MDFALHKKALFCCGIWIENITYPLYALHFVYKLTVLLIVCLFSISVLTECVIAFSANDDDAFQALFVAAPFCSSVLKMIIYSFVPKKINNLLKLFEAKICQPNTNEELVVWKTCKSNINKMFWTFFIIFSLCESALLLVPVLERELKNFLLPFKTYQPFEIDNRTTYWLLYLWQIFAMHYGVLFNITSDTLAYATILLLCGQYDILCLRILKIGNNNECYSMKYYAEHFDIIQNFIRYAQNLFMMGITPVFCLSLISISATIFNIVQVNLFSAKFMTNISLLTCLLLQIFLYCWFGNLLIEKSKQVSNTIYNCNWLDLSNIEKRNLRFFMQFSAKGNVFSYHGQCVLNLSTFVWIVKASYSAFNVLKGST